MLSCCRFYDHVDICHVVIMQLLTIVGYTKSALICSDSSTENNYSFNELLRAC